MAYTIQGAGKWYCLTYEIDVRGNIYMYCTHIDLLRYQPANLMCPTIQHLLIVIDMYYAYARCLLQVCTIVFEYISEEV